MRTVYPTNEIAHLWAHQTQAHARNAGRTFFFTGRRLYSYGSHFVVAEIIHHADPQAFAPFVFFNAARYSMSTNRHQRYARNAIPSHMRVVEVHAWESGDRLRQPADLVASLTHHVADLLAKAYRARVARDFYLDGAARTADDARFLAQFYGLPEPQFPSLSLEGGKAIAAAQARVAEQVRQQEREARERARIEMAAQLRDWRNGTGSIYLRTGWSQMPTALRVSPSDPDEVETTQGARFPVRHAVRLWPILKSLRERGESYQRNGHSIHLGEYVLDSFNAETGELRAGCHTLEWSEIERFARVLGLIDDDAQIAA